MITTGRPRSSSITVTTNHRYAFVLDNRATASSVPMASANTRVSAAAVSVLTSPMPNAVQTATKYWLTGLKIGPHLSASSWPLFAELHEHQHDQPGERHPGDGRADGRAAPGDRTGMS